MNGGLSRSVESVLAFSDSKKGGGAQTRGGIDVVPAWCRARRPVVVFILRQQLDREAESETGSRESRLPTAVPSRHSQGNSDDGDDDDDDRRAESNDRSAIRIKFTRQRVP